MLFGEAAVGAPCYTRTGAGGRLRRGAGGKLPPRCAARVRQVTECYIVNHAVLHLVIRFNFQAYHPTRKTIGYCRVLISTYESSKIADRSIIRLVPDQELSDHDLFFYDVG